MLKINKNVRGEGFLLKNLCVYLFREIDPEVYSYPHGQCRSVGVGGFLLGGGVNWMGTLNKLVNLAS